jgi:hypothetical protein
MERTYLASAMDSESKEIKQVAAMLVSQDSKFERVEAS